MKKYILAFIAAALFLYLHLIGIENSLYFYHWWYDVLLHFLGGLTIGLFIFLFTKSWEKVLACILIAAIGWEIFEYFLHIEILEGLKYALDTAKDLFMGLVGASFAISISKK